MTYDRAVRKDAFYWYQANWSDRPVLRLTSKRAVLRTAPEVEVKAYTAAVRGVAVQVTLRSENRCAVTFTVGAESVLDEVPPR